MFLLQVTDKGDPPGFSQKTINLKILDVNTETPSIEKPTGIVFVSEVSTKLNKGLSHLISFLFFFLGHFPRFGKSFER